MIYILLKTTTTTTTPTTFNKRDHCLGHEENVGHDGSENLLLLLQLLTRDIHYISSH